jgi:predicted transcriptional regulator
MAMTLRLTDEETEALRAQAEREGRSMQVVARAAIKQYIEQDGHTARVTAAAAEGVSRPAPAR